MISRREIESGTTGLEGDEQDGRAIWILKIGHNAASVPSRTVEPAVGNTGLLQWTFNQVQKTRPLGKHQGLVPVGNYLIQSFE